MLADDDSRVRTRALRVLAELPEESLEIARRVAVRLGDSDLQPRRWAAVVLLRIGEPAVPVLIDALERDSAEARWRAAWVLGQIGPGAEAATEALQALASDDPRTRVRRQATSALALIRGE